MKLYYMPGACSLSPHIVLNERLVFDKVKSTARRRPRTRAATTEREPAGLCPAARARRRHQDHRGPAIVQYIADKVPAKNLAPANGTPERIKLQSWLNFISSEVHKGFSPLFNTASEEAKKFFRERLGTRFAHVDKHLAATTT